MSRILFLASLVFLLAVPGFSSSPENHDSGKEDQESPSRISDEVIPVLQSNVPSRPKPILELGNGFLSTGPIHPGFKVPGGAVWQPSLLVFGTYRTALQAFHDGDRTSSEWANRLDLFLNLQLTGTERLLFGVRPLDEDGRFTGYRFNGQGEGREDELNFKYTTLFFEGELGELVPDLDPGDRGALDIGFSIGRQELFYQEGMLIFDDMDAIGITKDALPFPGASDLQATLVYGHDELNRDDNQEDHDAQLLGLFFSSDVRASSVNLDLAYVFETDDGTEGAHWGLSTVQRLGFFNTSFRYLGSQSLGKNTSGVSSGHLLFSEISRSIGDSHDLLYFNSFWGIDEFSSAARGPATGGPLGRAGILFEAVGLGTYGAPLGNRADDSVGGGIGLQAFSQDTRRQLVVELGGRRSTKSVKGQARTSGGGALALATRFQQAFGSHTVLQLDLFGSLQELKDEGYGARMEVRYEF